MTTKKKVPTKTSQTKKNAPQKLSASEKSSARKAPQKLSAAEKSSAKKAAPQKIASEKSAAKKIAAASNHPAREAQVNPRTVFEVIVKRVLHERRDFVTSVNGTIMFIVNGENPGVWTLDLRRGQVADVYPGKINDPSVMVAIEQQALGSFIEGRLDAKRAVAEHQLGVIGDKKMLAAFATALGAGSSLDLRSSLARSH